MVCCMLHHCLALQVSKTDVRAAVAEYMSCLICPNPGLCLLRAASLALQVNLTDIRAAVAEYVSCLISSDPGFACPLASSIMTADYVYSRADGSRSYAPKNYIGVLQDMPDVQVSSEASTWFGVVPIMMRAGCR